uniref:Uncharacterized protein n=1 Tax=Caenorhabditis japonica TaxID=281687 RepID=A0A8R1IVM1_CAEJA
MFLPSFGRYREVYWTNRTHVYTQMTKASYRSPATRSRDFGEEKRKALRERQCADAQYWEGRVRHGAFSSQGGATFSEIICCFFGCEC